MSIIIDADGTWEVVDHGNGVESRVLLEPSPTYLAAQEAERLAAAKASALLRLSERFREALAQGIEFDGHLVATDDHSRNLIAQTLLFRADAPPEAPQRWKTKDGDPYMTTMARIRAMAEAIGVYTDACYGHEGVLKVAIEAAEDPSAVDIESGWPDQETT